MSDAGCPACGCGIASDVHGVVAALSRDDLDAAIQYGLLASEPCPGCGTACRQRLVQARDERRGALAARDRYRARQARLARRAAERAARPAPPATAAADAAKPALPAAAADVLARALARAGKPGP